MLMFSKICGNFSAVEVKDKSLPL